MEQFTQVELEKRARWFMGTGVVFADDFMNKNIGQEKMKELCLSGAYVIKMTAPTPCLFITFGAGGAYVLDYPVARVMLISKTEAEQAYLSWLIQKVDPTNKYNIRSNFYHLDLSHGSIVKRPSDEDIANLQLKYRDWKNPPNKKARKQADDRLVRELRALDRRRLNEGGILPPPDRSDQISVIKSGPKKIKPDKLDFYRSDTDDEQQIHEEVHRPAKLPDILTELFGEEPKNDDDDIDDPVVLMKRKRDDDLELDYGIEIPEKEEEEVKE